MKEVFSSEDLNEVYEKFCLLMDHGIESYTIRERTNNIPLGHGGGGGQPSAWPAVCIANDAMFHEAKRILNDPLIKRTTDTDWVSLQNIERSRKRYDTEKTMFLLLKKPLIILVSVVVIIVIIKVISDAI